MESADEGSIGTKLSGDPSPNFHGIRKYAEAWIATGGRYKS